MTAISVSKGAGSVVNGYESITGQINLDYKKPDDIERYYFNAFQSSHFKTDLNANAAVQISENLSTLLLAHTDFVTKTFDDNMDSFADQPEVKQFNFMNRWHYQSFARLLMKREMRVKFRKHIPAVIQVNHMILILIQNAMNYMQKMDLYLTMNLIQAWD
jgi:hypothetical protein